MGILGQLFGGKQDRPPNKDTNVDWIELQSTSQLEGLINNDENRTQLIYKHSTTCGISTMVLRRLEQLMESSGGEADMYFLDIHRQREVSNAIATHFELRHQSPQLLILKRGRLVAAASHGAITEIELDRYL